MRRPPPSLGLCGTGVSNLRSPTADQSSGEAIVSTKFAGPELFGKELECGSAAVGSHGDLVGLSAIPIPADARGIGAKV
jgi:hypothetical protein